MSDEQSLAPYDNFNFRYLLVALVLLLAMPMLHVVLALSVYF